LTTYLNNGKKIKLTQFFIIHIIIPIWVAVTLPTPPITAPSTTDSTTASLLLAGREGSSRLNRQNSTSESTEETRRHPTNKQEKKKIK
jgi:hypothetical protein